MDKQNIYKFEITAFNKVFYFRMHYWAQWLLLLFFFGFISALLIKNSLIDSIESALILCGIIYVLGLVSFIQFRHAHLTTELIIDKDKREIRTFIFDHKKTVTVQLDNIKEAVSSPAWFRFYLKDGTWFSWPKDEESQEVLENIIKSLGIPVANKVVW